MSAIYIILVQISFIHLFTTYIHMYLYMFSNVYVKIVGEGS